MNIRELKFRAWHKRYKTMSDEFSFDAFDGDFYIRESDWHLKDMHIMQYTGLKDKNGVEIYEGDIVQSDGWYNMVVEYGIQEVDAFEGMGFNLWSFYDDDGNGYKANGKRLSSTYEVIGNIYENPELLDNQNKSCLKSH